MSEDKFDAIVVGAGVAGSVAALVMARAGLDVLVIERGDSAGCKNMTGGRLYAHTLEAIIPGFAVSAPVERKVTREKISFLTEESAVTLDFHREQPDVPQHASYTVLRNRLDPWLMEQAEQAGAQFIPGVRVDALVREGNKVTGVQAGDDILEANVVILADGCTIESNISLGGNRLLAAFFGTAEGKQQRFFWHGFTENFCRRHDRLHIGVVGKVVHTPFQNIKVRFTIGESFGFHAGDIFRHQRDDDFRCARTNDEIFYSYGFHFLPFLHWQQ